MKLYNSVQIIEAAFYGLSLEMIHTGYICAEGFFFSSHSCVISVYFSYESVTKPRSALQPHHAAPQPSSQHINNKSPN